MAKKNMCGYAGGSGSGGSREVLRQHVTLEPAPKMRIGCKCTETDATCYHYHNVRFCRTVS